MMNHGRDSSVQSNMVHDIQENKYMGNGIQENRFEKNVLILRVINKKIERPCQSATIGDGGLGGGGWWIESSSNGSEYPLMTTILRR